MARNIILYHSFSTLTLHIFLANVPIRNICIIRNGLESLAEKLLLMTCRLRKTNTCIRDLAQLFGDYVRNEVENKTKKSLFPKFILLSSNLSLQL